MTDSVYRFDSGARWYCVRSKPKKERMAAMALGSQFGLEVFCPRIRFRRKTVRGVVWFEEAMFPGYFFARFDLAESKRAVGYAPGVLCIPAFDGCIVPVPDEVIEGLREELNGRESVDAVAPLEPGERTTVIEGSLQGLRVTVVKVLPARDRVAVLMELLGNLVETELPVAALERRRRHPLAASA